MRVLSMGNIGHSQGLTTLVRAFEASDLPADVRLLITGSGVAADEARAEVRTDRVRMLGVLDDDELEVELKRATIAFVSQRYEGAEFNIPSKLMNFMAYGLPILAAVNPSSEVARIVRRPAPAGSSTAPTRTRSRASSPGLRGARGDRRARRRLACVRRGALHPRAVRRVFRRGPAGGCRRASRMELAQPGYVVVIIACVAGWGHGPTLAYP